VSLVKRILRAIVDWVDRHALSLGIILLLFLVAIAALSPRMFITIDAGHVGVLFRRFHGGTDITRFYPEGFHIIFPWDSMYVYDARYQNQSAVFDAHTKDGLNIKVDVAFRFRIVERNVQQLHKFVGPDYVAKLILPVLGARVREEVAKYSPADVYSSERNQIQENIRKQVREAFDISGASEELLDRTEFLEINEIFLRDVVLPESLQKSMVEKDQQEQMAKEYDYRLEREKKEAERKKIEAQGIRDFANIVKDGITDRYLMWRGIDATLQLAQSNNSKVIVVGAGKTGLPILLGNLDSTIAPPAGASTSGESKALAPLANTPEESGANREGESEPLPMPPAVTDTEKAGAPPAGSAPASRSPPAKPPGGAAPSAR
jgi:regulator of protease activity HflC (stomatin/prohibitin superfamily)